METAPGTLQVYDYYQRKSSLVKFSKDWLNDMQVSSSNAQQKQATLRGLCPHLDCKRSSAFVLVTNLYASPQGYFVGAFQCQGCTGYILGLLRQDMHQLAYSSHYPLGSPDDKVADEIPSHIKVDFKEALRCMFVNAYNATAEMCRRALEASCLEQGAPKKRKLDDMIDWLEEQRKITPRLQAIAHKIRLGGNRAAHPPEDGPRSETELPDEDGPIEAIGKEHAEAIIMFTREFFHHIYVVPAELDKYDFSKPKAAVTASNQEVGK
ncbi:MAG TPA: DUF4145 domain-containing protein [Acidobacteriaceae bacterium]